MYFWKIETLKEDIKAGKLTESDRFIYAFIYIAITAIGMEILTYTPIESPNMWDAFNSIGNIIIPLVGTFFAYRANGRANGTDFLGRFVSISFVVGIRFFALLIPLFLALFFYYLGAFPEGQEMVSTPADVLPFQIWLTFFYVRICKHIGDVKH